MKKGIEGLPFRSLISLLLVSAVIAIGLYEVGVISAFRIKNRFVQESMDMIQAMKSMQETGDYGSFSRVYLHIPQNCRIVMNNSSDEILIDIEGEITKKKHLPIF